MLDCAQISILAKEVVKLQILDARLTLVIHSHKKFEYCVNKFGLQLWSYYFRKEHNQLFFISEKSPFFVGKFEGICNWISSQNYPAFHLFEDFKL